MYTLRFDIVADVNQLRLWINAEYHPFHGGDIGIGQTEIGSQGDYGFHVVSQLDFECD
jgi:hypothetical protein